MDRPSAQFLIHSLKSFCWAIDIKDVCPDIAAKWRPVIERTRSINCPRFLETPVAFTIPELMDQIAAVDEASYRAMLSIPQFARSLTPGRIVDFMIGFGKNVAITKNYIVWIGLRGQPAEDVMKINYKRKVFVTSTCNSVFVDVFATHMGHLPAWDVQFVNPGNCKRIKIKIAERIVDDRQIIYCNFRYENYHRRQRFKFPISGNVLPILID